MNDEILLKTIILALVDKPEAVKIERTLDEMGVLLTLEVAPEDMGVVIGKAGNTAKAIRTILRVVGARQDARVHFKIKEPEGSNYRPSSVLPYPEPEEYPEVE